MKEVILALICIAFIACNSKPKVTEYDLEQKFKEQICVAYNALSLDDVSFRWPGLDAWKLQDSLKNKNCVFKVDFFSSLIKSGDSLLMVHQKGDIISKLHCKYRYTNVSRNDYVVFRIFDCNAVLDRDSDINFIITGEVTDVIHPGKNTEVKQMPQSTTKQTKYSTGGYY